jgi:hypothetical protein
VDTVNADLEIEIKNGAESPSAPFIIDDHAILLLSGHIAALRNIQ